MVIAGRSGGRNLAANHKAGLPGRRKRRHACADAGDHRLNGKRIGEADRQKAAQPPEPSELPLVEHWAQDNIKTSQQHEIH